MQQVPFSGCCTLSENRSNSWSGFLAAVPSKNNNAKFDSGVLLKVKSATDLFLQALTQACLNT